MRIFPEDIEYTFSKSSGPGGQNVNKVNSKATLRWSGVSRLHEDVRKRLYEKFGNRITSEGHLLITSDRFRDQRRNSEDCLEKLKAMLSEVLYPPKLRKATKPTRGSQRRRIEGKARLSEKKRQRTRYED